jgi:hypothetical protein
MKSDTKIESHKYVEKLSFSPSRGGNNCHNFMMECFYCLTATIEDLKYII